MWPMGMHFEAISSSFYSSYTIFVSPSFFFSFFFSRLSFRLSLKQNWAKRCCTLCPRGHDDTKDMQTHAKRWWAKWGGGGGTPERKQNVWLECIAVEPMNCFGAGKCRICGKHVFEMQNNLDMVGFPCARLARLWMGGHRGGR